MSAIQNHVMAQTLEVATGCLPFKARGNGWSSTMNEEKFLGSMSWTKHWELLLDVCHPKPCMPWHKHWKLLLDVIPRGVLLKMAER